MGTNAGKKTGSARRENLGDGSGGPKPSGPSDITLEGTPRKIGLPSGPVVMDVTEGGTPRICADAAALSRITTISDRRMGSILPPCPPQLQRPARYRRPGVFRTT